jgi:hypothetical protein
MYQTQISGIGITSNGVNIINVFEILPKYFIFLYKFSGLGGAFSHRLNKKFYTL